ncbi:MAG: hypothetical protein PVG75_00010 [Thioalkalispiraceae bacterium]
MLASSIESSNASEKNFILTAQQWNIPRSASSILGMQALQDAMRAFQSTENNRLLIKYPGGDEGTLWAYELRGWLVSLGVASDHIELIPGSGNPEQLEIMVIKPN